MVCHFVKSIACEERMLGGFLGYDGYQVICHASGHKPLGSYRTLRPFRLFPRNKTPLLLSRLPCAQTVMGSEAMIGI